MIELTCPNGHTNEYQRSNVTVTTDIAWDGDENPNVITTYYECRSCHIAFMVVRQGSRSEVRSSQPVGSYIAPPKRDEG